jgi:drug/metabolite transporter (DMT)-like permease
MAYICVASIVSYCIWFGIVKNGELSKLFIIKFAEPVFACIFSAVILGENILKWQYLISFALISAGILISNIRPNKKL